MEEADSDARRGNLLFRVCLAALVAMFCLPLGFCAWMEWRMARTALPPEVQWTDIIAFRQEGFFMESQLCGLYVLAPSSIEAFQLGEVPTGWQRAPIVIDEEGREPRRTALSALGATSLGCTAGRLKDGSAIPEVERVLLDAGTWHRTFHRGDGLIVVSPSHRLAWYLYYD
jgi:hypothetical protein